MKEIILWTWLFLQQQKDQVEQLKEKLAHDPDGQYTIGVVIGGLLPLVLLMGLAYFLYYKAKNRKE